ncbi:MAG: hydroxyacid dehydrogenase [Chloroflexota bacterium]
MAHRVLVVNPMAEPEDLALLQQAAEVVQVNTPTQSDEAAVIAAVKGMHAIIANPGSFVTRNVIMASDVLQVISVFGAGFDRVDVDAATERGILVVNNTGVGSNPVAEHALGMMIALAKDFRRADRMVRDQGWAARSHYFGAAMGIELDGLTLGIVGLGNIGSLLAKKAIAAFNMRVLAYDPYLADEVFTNLGVTRTARLIEMLPECDFVSIHAPATPETRHMIGREQLQAMKPTAYLINCARGPLVDPDALVEALRTGVIPAAGIDVFEVEPMPPDDPFFGVDNLLAQHC